jgi:hypothetical protein
MVICYHKAMLDSRYDDSAPHPQNEGKEVIGDDKTPLFSPTSFLQGIQPAPVLIGGIMSVVVAVVIITLILTRKSKKK